jgi:glutaminyl-tRNA synthetase
LCSLEFENHRPLYDWFLDNLPVPSRPRQIEFGRVSTSHVVLSKRKLRLLVEEGHVQGWDDPRMPTLRGMRRRGYTPEAIWAFTRGIGVTRTGGTVEYEYLEHCLREDLNKRSPRAMAVLDPVRVVLTNYPDGQVEEMEAVNNPEDPAAGTRRVPFSKVLYLEREDFMETPEKGFLRLAPGREVRLRYAYFITCTDIVKDKGGRIVELHCTYDPSTRGGDAPDGRKVKATLHWVSAAHAIEAEVRLYDHLFAKADPFELEGADDWLSNVNPDSLRVLTGSKLEPSLTQAKPGDRYQFERKGYFSADPDSRPGKPVFNLTVSLRDTWAKKRDAGQPT